MTSSQPIVITLPNGMFTFTPGADSIRCYLKWYETNGKENFEEIDPADCTYTTTPDVVTLYPRSAVLTDNIYWLIIENYDADKTFHNVGFGNAPLITTYGQTVSVEFTSVGKTGPVPLYRYGLKSRKITLNQVYVFEQTKNIDNMLVIDMNLPNDFDTHKE